ALNGAWLDNGRRQIGDSQAANFSQHRRARNALLEFSRDRPRVQPFRPVRLERVDARGRPRGPARRPMRTFCSHSLLRHGYMTTYRAKYVNQNCSRRPGYCSRMALKTRGERLRYARERFFKSARLAAKAMGIAVSTYGAHERAEDPGGRDFGPEEAKRYGRRFKVTPEWLLTGYGPGPDRQQPPYHDPCATHT